MKREFIKRLAEYLGEDEKTLRKAMRKAYADMYTSKLFTTISGTTSEDFQEKDLWREERNDEPMQKFISVSINIRRR